MSIASYDLVLRGLFSLKICRMSGLSKIIVVGLVLLKLAPGRLSDVFLF
jgi:hypothetical protein